jgi:hypothetical protein
MAPSRHYACDTWLWTHGNHTITSYRTFSQCNFERRWTITLRYSLQEKNIRNLFLCYNTCFFCWVPPAIWPPRNRNRYVAPYCLSFTLTLATMGKLIDLRWDLTSLAKVSQHSFDTSMSLTNPRAAYPYQTNRIVVEPCSFENLPLLGWSSSPYVPNLPFWRVVYR